MPNWYQLEFALSCHSIQICNAKQHQIDHDRLLFASTHIDQKVVAHESSPIFPDLRIDRPPRREWQCWMQWVHVSHIFLILYSVSLCSLSFGASFEQNPCACARTPSILNEKNWSEQDSNLQPRELSIIFNWQCTNFLCWSQWSEEIVWNTQCV